MSKVSDTGGDQGDAILVATIDGVLVSHRSARMSDGFDAGLARFLDGITPSKRKEHIASNAFKYYP